ncbi:hypothetical protein BGZ72_005759 [Mortierella alpina]|nr:hypothetical protein BGZ72_005759 [Mortierella alpina]
MLRSIRAIPIAAVMLCLFGTALSAPTNKIEQPFNVVQGGDPRTLLHDLASSLDPGSRPEGWERLMHTPETNGTSGMEILSPANLLPVVKSWGIDETMYNRTFESITNLIHTAIGEGIYVARGFSYTLPKCVDKARPVCLTTLIVAARVKLDADEQIHRVELGHIYMKSGADSIEQPGRLALEELGDIESVLNSIQSKWALDHVPVPRDLETPQSAPISLYSVETKVEQENSSLENLLEQIIENNVENKEVFKDHQEELLDAIQEATESREQSMNNMQLIVSPKEVPRLLQNTLANCFKAAGMKESVSKWWARVYPDLAGKPISVECSAASQRKDKISPPRHNCTASSNVTTATSYSWVMIAPKGKALEVVLLENQVDVNFMDCDMLNDPSDSSASIPDSTSNGAVIRWASVQPDGSFRPVQYLNSWSLYPENIDKAMMDILRYDTATGYLNVITPEANSYSEPQTQRLPEASAAALALSDNSKALLLAPRALPAVMLAIDAIVKAIGAFAETWEKVAKAFSSGMTKTIQRRVCLGFDAVDFHADSFVINGVARNDLSPMMEELANIAELPKRGDVRSALVGMKYSSNFTWTGENMMYRDQAGNMGFLFLGKQGDAKTGEANLVYSRVTSNFKLAEDMLLVRRQISVLGGIWKSDTTEISHVPHTFTPQDTQIMQMFWQMIAFRQLAMSAGIDPPAYPDLSFLCDRSIKDSQ